MRGYLYAIIICLALGLTFGWAAMRTVEIAATKCEVASDDQLEGWVYAITEIPEGSIIRSEQLAVKPAVPSNFPGMIARKNDVAGLRAVYGITVGQIIDCHNVELPRKKLRKKKN